MNTIYIDYKNENKKIAKEIRSLKNSRKAEERKKQNLSLSSLEFKIHNLKMKYRHTHIALSMFRGKSYVEIERNSSKTYDENIVKNILLKLEKSREQESFCQNNIFTSVDI